MKKNERGGKDEERDERRGTRGGKKRRPGQGGEKKMEQVMKRDRRKAT